MSEKKIDLIAQLLAKAESTTPEEAEALTAAATKMMAKYMIDQATIDARRAEKGQASEKIVQEVIKFRGAYRGEMLHLSFMVVSGLGTLRGLQSTWGDKGKEFYFYLIGFESDVAQAKVLISSLQIQATVAVRDWWKTNKGEHAWRSAYEQEKVRRDFVHGFGTGAGSRIRENRQQVVEEATTGTDLVLVDRRKKVDEHVSNMSTSKGRARTATGGGAASGHGYAAGRKANTGEKGVTRGRGLTA